MQKANLLKIKERGAFQMLFISRVQGFTLKNAWKKPSRSLKWHLWKQNVFHAHTYTNQSQKKRKRVTVVFLNHHQAHTERCTWSVETKCQSQECHKELLYSFQFYSEVLWWSGDCWWEDMPSDNETISTGTTRGQVRHAAQHKKNH